MASIKITIIEAMKVKELCDYLLSKYPEDYEVLMEVLDDEEDVFVAGDIKHIYLQQDTNKVWLSSEEPYIPEPKPEPIKVIDYTSLYA